MRKLILLSLFITILSSMPAGAREVLESFDFQVAQARLLDVTPQVTPSSLTVDVEVIGKRMRKTVSLSKEALAPFIIPGNDEATINNLRSYAVFKLSDKYDFDLLVAATFDVHITEKGATIRVVGYPANFVNWGGKPTETELKPRAGYTETDEGESVN